MKLKIYWLLLVGYFFISGCSHVQWVKDTYDPVTQKRTGHQIISSSQIAYFSVRKDVWAIHDDITFNIGNSKQDPNFSSEFLGLFSKFIMEQSKSNILMEGNE